MTLIAIAGLASEVFLNAPLNPVTLLEVTAGLCLFASCLLNPALVKGNGIAILIGKRVLPICNLLAMAAGGFFVLSRAVLMLS